MSGEEGKESSAVARKKALDALARMEINDRIAKRKERSSGSYGLLAILFPLWIWMLGLGFLPDAMPLFARAMFHASCWGGFAWLAFSAWRRAQEDSPARKSKARRDLEEDIERARRRRQIRDS